MRCLSILLFISAAAFCTAQRNNETSTLVELERRAIELEVRATRELRNLRQTNSTRNSTEVRELERLEREVAELATEVLRSAARANSSQLERLESRLIAAEDELQAAINALNSSTVVVVKRQALDPLLLVERAVQLELQARSELDRLRRANRTNSEIRELERLADDVARLAGDVVRDVVNSTDAELRRVEERLRDAETALAAELQRLNRTVTNTTNPSNTTLNATQLVVRALELEALGNRAIDRVNRTEARELERLVADVARLASDVVRDSATSTPQQLLRLEERLLAAENELAAELRALNLTSAFRFKRQAQLNATQLETRALQLEVQAQREIDLLRASNRSSEEREARELNRVLREVETLASELLRSEARANNTELRRIEERLRTAEQDLTSELRRLNRTSSNTTLTLVKRQAQLNATQLERRALELEVQAQREIDLLRASNRSSEEREARELNRVLRDVETLASELLRSEARANNTELRRIEERLRTAEQDLTSELRRLNRTSNATSSLVKRQTQTATQLETRALELEVQSQREVDALRAANRTADARELERVQREVSDLASQLLRSETRGSDSELRRIEERLRTAEQDLSAELRRLQNRTRDN